MNPEPEVTPAADDHSRRPIRPVQFRIALVLLAVVAGLAFAGQYRKPSALVSTDVSDAGVIPAQIPTDSARSDLNGPADRVVESASVADVEPAPEASKVPEPESGPDAGFRQQIVGNWQMTRDGTKRELTVTGDGEAVMRVELGTPVRLVFGEQMTFDIRWTVADGVLTMKTVGGEPETSVNLVLKTYGDTRSHPIVSIDDRKMVLLDPDEGEPEHEWTRVSADATADQRP